MSESKITPRWIRALLAPLVPSFSIVTFCEDPDGLMERSEVREALRDCGMSLGDWNGSVDALTEWTDLPDDAKPLVVVGPLAKRHLAETHLQDSRWETVSVGALMPKFYSEVVKAVPSSLWDKLLDLHDQERFKRPPQETAVLIGRAIYGADPEYLRHGDGWISLLLRLSIEGEGLPAPIARALAEALPAPQFMGDVSVYGALTEPAMARTALLSAQTDAAFTVALSEPERLLLPHIMPVSAEASAMSVDDLNAAWESQSQASEGVLSFGLAYAEAVNAGLPVAERIAINRKFAGWLMQSYALFQSAANPAILRLPRLLRQLDSEMANDRMVLIVVDSLGLHAWINVQARWKTDGIIRDAHTRSAFAVLPTITNLSRRAIFEEKLPVSFSTQKHAQSLERTLWASRFDLKDSYFSVDEIGGFQDALALGKPRLCVMDVSWDKRGHSIDPRTDTIRDAARAWAGRTPLTSIIQKALAAGYRVIVTADHGQVECVGHSRLNVGSLPEERSKRVMIFSDAILCQSFASEWTTAFRPTGLPMDMHPLFANDFFSFDLMNTPSASHGGMSLDEVIVPVAELFA